jgi:hypothetical protein
MIFSIAGTYQQGSFVEGVADGICMHKNRNPTIGFIADGVRGVGAIDVRDYDLITSGDLRLRAGAIFWHMLDKTSLDPLESVKHAEAVKNLLYVWMAQRHVTEPHQVAFDSAVLLDQLLVADAVMTGQGRVTHKPPHLEDILRGFKDLSIFNASFIRGDFDGSGAVDLSDAVGVLNYLFLGGKDNRCLEAMDANDDSAIDVSDPLSLLYYLFLGGAAPADPFPFCDIDFTPMDLWCAETPAACQI